MTKRLKQYDDAVAPRLRRIRHCAKMVAYYIRQIEAEAAAMPFVPDWPTQAEADLEDAAFQVARIKDLLKVKMREKV